MKFDLSGKRFGFGLFWSTPRMTFYVVLGPLCITVGKHRDPTMR